MSRPGVGFLDMHAGGIDQVHIVHLHRAGGHARHARQAAVQVRHCLRLGRRAAFQHFLDQVDAAARRVVFVVQQHIRGAARGAKAIVLAGLENLVGFGDVDVGQLIGREICLHAKDLERWGRRRCRRPALVCPHCCAASPAPLGPARRGLWRWRIVTLFRVVPRLIGGPTIAATGVIQIHVA